MTTPPTFLVTSARAHARIRPRMTECLGRPVMIFRLPTMRTMTTPTEWTTVTATKTRMLRTTTLFRSLGRGVDPDAKGAVEQWKIVAVGHRPEDRLARDCLYSALLRDHRATWFRRYLERPSAWMEALVALVRDKADQRRALQCVVLDYQHKLHLARLYPRLVADYGDPDDYTFFRRVWHAPRTRCRSSAAMVAVGTSAAAATRGCVLGASPGRSSRWPKCYAKAR